MAVPFFSDFTKRTKDYFKRDKYDLGQGIEIAAKCGGDIGLKGKFSSVGGPQVRSKFVATMKRDNGREIEVTEDLNKGLGLKVTLPKLYRNIDLQSEHSNADVEVTAKYQPSAEAKNSFYSAKVAGYFNPSKNGKRVCSTKAEFAVGDDQLNLSVGGDITIVDEAKNDGASQSPDPKIKSYTLGFLYTPSKSTQYSVIYTPDAQSNGMEYEFTCFRRMSEKCALSAKAFGKVDTKLTGYPPVISLAGGWTLGANYLQAFVNSRKEWGMAYKVRVSDTASLNLGVSSFLSADQRSDTKFGYKLSV
eukprot:CAMPEP_0202695374 /NCGR_PEP_ID=MMETSP1385-20130828/8976_1 /ASSEMBLY_ACC=CAM_ASM_000861 /TAXON_ID=933848 /ORGANISM="Elphidium margaritaceum" /LENGTH=303 /DNA_ID=CAMNT_0049351387 /DNA_START=45 /DNA_END=956 /DNA_ORIENTATION=-